MRSWGGRGVRRKVAEVLAAKGRTCHLCGLPGANSADHDPPRSVLVARGVPDPDALMYLWPSHRLPCNIKRGTRPVTAALRAELRDARLKALGIGTVLPVSSSLASRRPTITEEENTA